MTFLLYNVYYVNAVINVKVSKVYQKKMWMYYFSVLLWHLKKKKALNAYKKNVNGLNFAC